jgi:MFS family permease
MAGGSFLGAIATQLFGMSLQPGIFFLSRTVEGVGAAAVTPSLLSHLTDATDGNHSLRARVMSYFELSLLAGLALGGLTGAQLWHLLSTHAFSAVAAIYVSGACLLVLGAVGSRGHGSAQAISGFHTALKEPSLQRLAPVWLCVNTIVGLWLGPTLPFLLTRKGYSGQFLDGVYSNQPERVGWLLLGYSLIFGIGVTAWSFVLPLVNEQRALRIALVAMVGVCLALLLLNHSGAESPAVRWAISALTALWIMVESGFTPAALSLLAGAIGAQAGRGAAMGIYSVLLSIGAIVGSLLAAAARAGIKGIQDLGVLRVLGQPNLNLTVDRGQAARYQINVADVQDAIQTAVGGNTLTQVLQGEARYDLVMRYLPQYRTTKEAIEDMRLQSPTGVRVSLSQLCKIEERDGGSEIYREANQRYVPI